MRKQVTNAISGNQIFLFRYYYMMLKTKKLIIEKTRDSKRY